MQDTIKELREEMQSISFAAYEASADRHKQEKKHLIIGNHDSPCSSLSNYFVSTSQIKEVTFKKIHYSFLDVLLH